MDLSRPLSHPSIHPSGRGIPSLSIQLLRQILVVMAARHRLIVEWRRLGHIVACGTRAVANNWGRGKGGPTAAGPENRDTVAAIFFRSVAVVGLQVGEGDCTIP
jgi:hypothetical protein